MAEEVIAINIVAVAEGGVFIISATIEEEKEEEEIEEGTGAETGTKTTTMGAEEEEEESEEETTETTTTNITTTTTTEEEEEKEEEKEELKKAEENCRTRRESSRINASSINTSGLTRIHLRTGTQRKMSSKTHNDCFTRESVERFSGCNTREHYH